MALMISGADYWLAIEKMAERIAESKDYITQLDSATGDGDHWVNMNMGFTALLERKEQLKDLPLPEMFKDIGKTLMTSVGGSSGILYATAYLAAAKETAGKTEITLEELSRALQTMADGIMKRGKSQPGNKTMVDAIVPAAQAMQNALQAGKGDAEVLTAMKEAAIQGAEATKAMAALRGRAFYQEDKGVGHLDPGAVTMSYQLSALADSLLDQLG